MFDALSHKLTTALKKLTGKQLTQDTIKAGLREVRAALLEADVALAVVTDFIQQMESELLGLDVSSTLSAEQFIVQKVHQALTRLMGESQASLNLRCQPPAVILVAGLQGAGKTTTLAKLGYWLRTTQQKTVMVVSADTYRPAAIEQLATLATQAELSCYPSDPSQSPQVIVEGAITAAKRQAVDVLLVDTAGRLHIDAAMMAEIKTLHQLANPIETLFVVDSMTGQDAANTAKAFHEAIPLTGVILTKTDGDARGGAALSVRHITGKPIKFMGKGERIQDLGPFHPDRVASDILGMGDILSLAEDIQQKVDKNKAAKLAKKVKKGGFNFNDYLEQLTQIQQMGGVNQIVSKLPGFSQLPDKAKSTINDDMFKPAEAMIYSMTPQERLFPNLLNPSRKKRIALGSGVPLQEVNKIIKQFEKMQKMMRRMSGGKMAKRMAQLAKMQGGMH